MTNPHTFGYFYGLSARTRIPIMAKAAASPSQPAAAATPASFEAALAELDNLVKAMEGGHDGQPLSLEDSITAYQRGMALLRYCQEALGTAEQKIQMLENGALRDFGPSDEA